MRTCACVYSECKEKTSVVQTQNDLVIEREKLLKYILTLALRLYF